MTDAPVAYVLDVGQCNPDHHAIKSTIVQNFEAEVDRVHLTEEAMDALRQKQYQLVLVNRILDQDGSKGMKLIQQIKQDSQLHHIPVIMTYMLVGTAVIKLSHQVSPVADQYINILVLLYSAHSVHLDSLVKHYRTAPFKFRIAYT